MVREGVEAGVSICAMREAPVSLEQGSMGRGQTKGMGDPSQTLIWQGTDFNKHI